jgi:hypothetical protein
MDQERRKFLKIILMGSGILITGKILGPLYSWFSDNSSAEKNIGSGTDGAKEVSENFRVNRNNGGLSIYDTSGQEIFQIDDEA